MAKEIKFSEDARSAMLSGVDKLADTGSKGTECCFGTKLWHTNYY